MNLFYGCVGVALCVCSVALYLYRNPGEQE